MDLGEGGEASGGFWALPPSPARSQHGVRPWDLGLTLSYQPF